MSYGIIENNKCVNVIEAEADFAESIGAVEIPEGFWIGDYYDGEWYHEKPITVEEQLRADIDFLAAMTGVEL